MDKEIILTLAETVNVLLWGFDVELRDRRDGSRAQGRAVVIGNKDYDIQAAVNDIERKYSALGYELMAAVFTEQKTYKLETNELYNELKADTPDERAENVAGIGKLIGTEYVKEDYSSWQSCSAAVDAAINELEG